MAETAAHVVDHVLPHVPVRQWVLTLPMALRYRAGFHPALSSAILELFLRTVFGWLRRKARDAGVADGRAGAVTVIQRAGGSVNANLHYHSLVLDGVYVRRDPGSNPSFHATAPPSPSDLADMLTTVRVGIRRRLERRGLIRSETGEDEADPHAEAAPVLAACYAASVQGTVAMGPKAGHYVGRLGGELAALPDSMPPPASCVRADGYSLHAGGPGRGWGSAGVGEAVPIRGSTSPGAGQTARAGGRTVRVSVAACVVGRDRDADLRAGDLDRDVGGAGAPPPRPPDAIPWGVGPAVFVEGRDRSPACGE
jgi:hypothetical protein